MKTLQERNRINNQNLIYISALYFTFMGLFLICTFRPCFVNVNKTTTSSLNLVNTFSDIWHRKSKTTLDVIAESKELYKLCSYF